MHRTTHALNFAADECPCDYDVIPKTLGCWEECEFCDEIPPVYTTTGRFLNGCELFQFDESEEELSPRLRINTFTPESSTCLVTNDSNINPSCTDMDISQILEITLGEAETYQCRLEQYTKGLIEEGITVTDGDGVPLSDEEISCPAQE